MSDETPPDGLDLVHGPSVPKAAYLLVAIVVCLLIVIMSGGYLYTSADSNRDEQAQATRDRQGCIAKLNSDVLIAFGDAFGTAPAPGTDRAAAVKQIHTTAEILKQADIICTPTLNQRVYDRVLRKVQSGG